MILRGLRLREPVILSMLRRCVESRTTLGDISLLDRSMYYWAPAVQALVEQHIGFDATQPPIFSPPDASHVSIICYFICTN